MIDVDYPALLNLFPQHVAKDRSESASFLIWYLENYYRLDSEMRSMSPATSVATGALMGFL